MTDTDAFAALNEMAGSATDAMLPEPAKPGAKVTDDPEPNPAATVPEPKHGTAPKQPEAAKAPEKASALRARLDETKAQLATLAKERDEWKQKASSPKDDPEKKTLQEKLTAQDKRLAEMEETVRYTSYQHSQEYKDKYEAPFVNAYTAGREKAASMRLKQAAKLDDAGNVLEPEKVRNGSAEDFDALMRITDDGDAAEFASTTYGGVAPLMLYHREKVQEANAQRLRAIEDFKKTGAARLKEQTELSDKQQKEFVDKWQSENVSAIEKYPKLFKADDGDDKGKTLLEKGFQLADLAFNSSDLPTERRVKLLSAVRNKAAAFDYQVYRTSKLQAQLTELQAKLKAFEESEPGPGDGGGRSGGQPAADSMDSVVASLDTIATSV